MTIAIETRAHSELAEQIAHFLLNAPKAIARRRAFLQTRRELSALGPHELADLGLTQATVDQAAYKAVYGVSR